MLSIIEWYLAVFFCACCSIAETCPNIKEKRIAKKEHNLFINKFADEHLVVKQAMKKDYVSTVQLSSISLKS